MKTGCINHPSKEPLIKIHHWQIEFCEGNVVAAALLSFFEYWHDIKEQIQGRMQRLNELAELHGDKCRHDDSLLQFHTEEDLEKGVMIAKKDTIRKAIKYLEGRGVISVHSNPAPRYAFDKTRYFLMHPDTVNAWLDERSGAKITAECTVTEESSTSLDIFPKTQTKLQSSYTKLQAPSPKNRGTITEITPEITNGDLRHTLPTLSDDAKQPGEREETEFEKINVQELATVNSSDKDEPESTEQPKNFRKGQSSAAGAGRFNKNQSKFPKRIDGSDQLPWDTAEQGQFDPGFEQHMARSLMAYPAYRDLLAGELQTKVRKHISAGRYDLRRRDELLIEWQAYQAGVVPGDAKGLTAKQVSRRANIAKALGLNS